MQQNTGASLETGLWSLWLIDYTRRLHFAVVTDNASADIIKTKAISV